MEPENGIVSLPSPYSVAETVARLQQSLQIKGVQVFAVIDHSGEAEKAGLQMPDTKLIIFGNPKAGTPLMQAAPTIAIDLPLKILVWEAADSRVWVAYNSPEFIGERHNVPPGLVQTLAAAALVAKEIVT